MRLWKAPGSLRQILIRPRVSNSKRPGPFIRLPVRGRPSFEFLPSQLLPPRISRVFSASRGTKLRFTASNSGSVDRGDRTGAAEQMYQLGRNSYCETNAGELN